MSDWVVNLIDGMGYLGITFLMFLETVFPPIPSELIMSLAGIRAGQGELDYTLVVLAGTTGVLRVGGEILELGRLPELLEQSRDCVREVFASAGIDMDLYPGSVDYGLFSSEAFQKARAEGRSPTKVEMRGYKPLVGPDDYPAKAYSRGESGTVRAALLIGTDGRVERCVILMSATELLDEATCKALKERAEFEPELDENGLPIPSITVTVPIRWERPG